MNTINDRTPEEIKRLIRCFISPCNDEWERFTQNDGYCHNASKRMCAEVKS